MLEKEIERKVTIYARNKNFLAYKFTSPSNRSVPDRIFISPKGETIYVEFKQKGKLPTRLQNITFNRLKDRGVTVMVIDDYLKGKMLIDEYDRTDTSVST